MSFAVTVLVVLGLTLLGVLPVWPFSRDWGYVPAIVVGIVVAVLLVMAATGRVPGITIH
jgi:hypothetical protein